MYKREILRGWLVPGEWVAVRVDLAVGSIHSPRRNLASSFAFVPLRRACLRSCQPQGSLPDVLYPCSGELAKASLQIPVSPNISNWPSRVANKSTKRTNSGDVFSARVDAQRCPRRACERITRSFRKKMLLGRFALCRSQEIIDRVFR